MQQPSKPTGIGHWDVSASDGRQIFCSVSGGYVLVGVRLSKSSFEVHDSANAQIDQYSGSPVREFIKKNMGDKVLEEVDAKVTHLLAIRNKATMAPGKE